MLWNAEDSLLMVVDVQEKLTPLMDRSSQMVHSCKVLAEAAELLEVPVFWLEQYPKGLGPTVSSLSQVLAQSHTPKRKLSFSGCLDSKCRENLRELGYDQVLVIGIEAHICVYQTVMDLLGLGKKVQVAVDAVSSRNPLNKEIALRKMERAGAELTTVEMILFEWLRSSKHPQFKAVQKLIT
jgi:nicotinamidase-related amidase